MRPSGAIVTSAETGASPPTHRSNPCKPFPSWPRTPPCCPRTVGNQPPPTGRSRAAHGRGRRPGFPGRFSVRSVDKLQAYCIGQGVMPIKVQAGQKPPGAGEQAQQADPAPGWRSAAASGICTGSRPMDTRPGRWKRLNRPRPTTPSGRPCRPCGGAVGQTGAIVRAASWPEARSGLFNRTPQIRASPTADAVRWRPPAGPATAAHACAHCRTSPSTVAATSTLPAALVGQKAGSGPGRPTAHRPRQRPCHLACPGSSC